MHAYTHRHSLNITSEIMFMNSSLTFNSQRKWQHHIISIPIYLTSCLIIHRHRHTDTQTQTHTHKDTQTHRDTHTRTHRDTNTHKDTQTHRDTQTQGHTETHTHTQGHTQSNWDKWNYNSIVTPDIWRMWGNTYMR